MVSSNAKATITFTEVDETNHPTATYIYSESQEPSSSSDDKIARRGRVDVLHPSSAPSSPRSLKTLVDLLVDVFLPSGYPHSVTDDYLPRVYFHLATPQPTNNPLGVGVGNADATPTSALLLHILQDTSGRIATILFAHRVGTALEPECKMYRLAADVFNDLAMILDCLSPMIPAGVSRITVLSTAGVLRALCGVAGGSSKASLSAHFARGGNLAEVNAKDSSQETIISLVGMLVGSLVVSHVTGFAATWLSLLFLLAAHLAMNYAAVRAVQMTSLNRQRANIVFSTLLDSDPAFTLAPDPQSNTASLPLPLPNPPTPAQVSYHETIFERDGLLAWKPISVSSTPLPTLKLGYAHIGVSLTRFLRLKSSSSSRSRSSPPPLTLLATLFADEEYILFITQASSRPTSAPTYHAGILLKRSCGARAQLKAWAHALLAARVLSSSASASAFSSLDSGEEREGEGEGRLLGVVADTLRFLNRGDRFGEYLRVLEAAGWDLDIAALETRSGRRIAVDM
ncbi:RUS1 family protein [Aspergillus clavatus NRRL 1]|uniref:DUF647 domain protein n=1 Tax=Aspergillus clavatus (strain ATCC 1007 / CBS 513.65 / DSM 816 / NCTC 3887 / NRRL 1 / QM 1276 / 107) TaxID=344612 RepID=A1CE75_ASPCL|nr:DUF647 domain protein [Aspergillus clavatus NRRL 1]EAW11174.1 DUF647 domain protein [Aspergillus clavatus NRRL 1]